ncbi:putative receptor-like protein kinase At3g47110 [Coffea eugenioides]|uniref:putative receptor-like protein kinase At3g47110 n=1 Tax=Coffea eugenioides TaxID=49369 RepID=UPI000F611AB1|nr:putative receptor-like protein kinase At3g47110 [Coffea eugenioides]
MAYERKNFRQATSSCCLFYTLFHIFIPASAAAIHFETRNLTFLRELNIQDNNFHGMIPEEIFSISRNNLGGNIPSEICRLSNLHVLELSSNKLLGAVPPQLYNISTLQIFSITNNLLSGQFPVTVGLTLPNLTLFLADLNLFFGSIPTTLANASGLIKISIGDNSLTGSIPQNLGSLRELQELYLSENSFTGEIPSTIGDISELQILVLEQNMLTGNIPVSLSNCSNLQGFTVSQNRLSGALPKELLGLSSLSLGLLLAQNQFTGSLPSEVGNLKNLVSLDISENKLSGEIPTSIDGCEMLEYLRLKGNFLEGSVPSTLGELISIQVIDLSQNNLSEQIPASLAKLKFISTLNLSYNMLEGEVPMDGIFANSSAFSALGNGKLCGGIKALNLSSCPKPTKKKAKLSTPITKKLKTTITFYLCSRKTESEALSYAELYDSTNGFSSENLIGEGKYGSVYKGVLKPGEQMVAVKVLKLHQHGAHKSFLAECVALRNIRHRNLVKIITSCSSLDFKHNDFKALIFEYVPNGSLENWLHPSSAEEEGQSLMKLQLIQRLNIAIDIASALDYLHNHCGTPIIHCDLKRSNILLGDDFRAMVSDFGLAKFLSFIEGKSHQHQSNSVAIRGTVGYVAAEYGMGGEVSTQGDVYSYGILLLELFTGKTPTDSMFTEDFSLHSYVKMALPHQVMEIVDPKISMEAESIAGIITKTSKGGSINQEERYLSMFWIGVSCSSEIQRDRMNIKDVLSGLQAIRNEFIQVINESQMR